MRLSAAMIMRNEALHLDACLRSIRPHVDEIVIVDTGSTDASPEIARRYEARLLQQPWQEDFAAPRNLALAAAKGDWILYIDADERLRLPPGTTLAPLLEDREKLAWRLRLQPKTNYTAYAEVRIFRNHPEIRYRGVIHERVLPDILRLAAGRADAIGHCDLVLEHVGYEGDQHRKHERNLPMLRRYLETEPERIFCWWHMGEILAELGRPEEAAAAFAEGIARTRRRGERAPLAEDSLPFAGLLRLELDRGKPVGPLLGEALALFPENRLLRWIAARHEMASGRPAAALPLLRALAAEDGERFYDPLIAYDKRLFGEFAQASLGVCYMRLGRHDLAAEAFAAAARFAPEDPSYPVKQRLAAARHASCGCGEMPVAPVEADLAP